MYLKSDSLEELKNALAGEPCFVLGNSPRLPIESLGLLDGYFTVGVNRICEVYDPTVLLIGDKSAYDLAEPNFGKSQKLLSPEMGVRCEAWYPQLHSASLNWSKHPGQLHLDGNSGVGAASWASSLGCSPIYLVGMEAAYAQDGDTDFYGVNAKHRNGTLTCLRAALDRLVNEMPHCVQIANAAHLRKMVKRHEPHNREFWMEKLCQPILTTTL